MRWGTLKIKNLFYMPHIFLYITLYLIEFHFKPVVISHLSYSQGSGEKKKFFTTPVAKLSRNIVRGGGNRRNVGNKSIAASGANGKYIMGRIYLAICVLLSKCCNIS